MTANEQALRTLRAQAALLKAVGLIRDWLELDVLSTPEARQAANAFLVQHGDTGTGAAHETLNAASHGKAQQ